jgi:hypothetical protein
MFLISPLSNTLLRAARLHFGRTLDSHSIFFLTCCPSRGNTPTLTLTAFTWKVCSTQLIM